jgi:CRP-like cAMP-binding protein
MARAVDWPSIERTSALLAALPEAARHAARLQEIRPGARLFNRGDRPKAMFFVVSGEVQLVRQSAAGNTIVLQRARSGFIAEASLDQAAYHCDALAVSPSQVVVVPGKAFRQALAEDDFRSRWIVHLGRELRRTRTQVERLGLKSAEERIIHYIETEGDDGTLRLTRSRKEWAAELGLTHEALYRALARMQRSGDLLVEGASLSIQSRDRSSSPS